MIILFRVHVNNGFGISNQPRLRSDWKFLRLTLLEKQDLNCQTILSFKHSVHDDGRAIKQKEKTSKELSYIQSKSYMKRFNVSQLFQE